MNSKYQLFLIATLCAFLVLLGGSVVLGLSWLASPTAKASNALQAEAPQRTIMVIGEGMVSAPPDIAIVDLGVQVSDPDVKAATEKAGTTMETILAALKAQGVADADIRTSYYNIYVDRPYSPDGAPVQGNYQVNNNLQVTIRNLDKISEILGAAVEAGVNSVNSVTFNLSDPSTLQAEGRQKAVDDAVATAEELAQLNGVSVGEVVSVSEVVQATPFYAAEFAVAQGVGGGGVGPITPGDVNITVQLQITYAILQ
jgi:hypothetical protein